MSDHGSSATVHCPLCNGPLHLEDSGFVCAVGHEVSSDDVERHTQGRLAQAMWMAIEALDSEAMMLRLLSETPDAERMASEAEQQSELLRQFSRHHQPRNAEDPGR